MRALDDTDLDRLSKAGLYDPDREGADQRLALIEYLVELGATVDEMIAVAHIPGGISGLAAIAALPKPTLSLNELARMVGATPERVAAVWSALGLILPDMDEPALSTEEAEVLAGLTPTLDVLPDPVMMQVLRAAGGSAARLADAMVQAYLTDVETDRSTELDRAQLAASSTQLLDLNLRALGVVLKRHMTQSAFRLRTSQAAGLGTATMAIGFVDLVGFTALSIDAGQKELLDLLDEFEAIAIDAVNANGGWVIKLIGDAVMFGALEPGHAVNVAIALMDAMGPDRPSMRPRGGLAYGGVVPRGGDYFGPVVNVASRIVGVAVPDEVLITRKIRDSVGSMPEGWLVEPAGQRQLKGIEGPIGLWSLRHDTEVDSPF